MKIWRNVYETAKKPLSLKAGRLNGGVWGRAPFEKRAEGHRVLLDKNEILT